MKAKELPFRCLTKKESEVFINLKADKPVRLLGVAILDKVRTDSDGNPVTCNVKRGEAKIRNLGRQDLLSLRQWSLVKVLDLMTKNEWVLDMKTYRYAPGRLDSHDRIRWNLVAFRSTITADMLATLDAQGLQGEIQLSLL